MNIWIPYFSVTLLLGVFARNVTSFDSTEENDIRKLSNDKKQNISIFLVFLILFLFCAFKMISASSNDEFAYRHRFDIYSTLTFRQMISFCNGEYINGLLVWCSTRLFHSNQGIFIVFSFITYLFYVKGFFNYCKDFSFAVVLLMVTGIVNTSLNITQQSLACAVFFCFSYLIFERKLWKFIVLVLVCVMIHKGSFILFFFYFLFNRKQPAIKPAVLLVVFPLLLLYNRLNVFVNYFNFLESYSDVARNGHAGVKYITIIINCVPGLLALLYSKNRTIKDRITELSANMCLVHAAIYIACIYDRFIARFAMFSAPFCIVFLSRSLDLFSNEKDKRIFKGIAILLYSLELFLRVKLVYYYFNFSF